MRFHELIERRPTKPERAYTPVEGLKQQARKDRLANRAKTARKQCAAKIASLNKQMFEGDDEQ